MVSILPLIPSSLIPSGSLEPFRAHKLQLVLAWRSYLTPFSVLGLVSSICLFFAFFYFLSVVLRDDKIHNTASFPFFFLVFFFFFFFLLLSTRSSFLVGIWWFFCISKFLRISWVSFSRTDSHLCIYYLVIWSNFNLWCNSLLITFPNQLCLVLYSFCSSLLHLFIMWLTDSFFSPRNLHLLHLLLRLSYQLLLVVFHRSQTNRKSPQVSNTFSILADLSAVIWMVLILLLIPSS